MNIFARMLAGTAVLALGAAAVAAVLKMAKNTQVNYTEIDIEDVTEEQQPAGEDISEEAAESGEEDQQ